MNHQKAQSDKEGERGLEFHAERERILSLVENIEKQRQVLLPPVDALKLSAMRNGEALTDTVQRVAKSVSMVERGVMEISETGQVFEVFRKPELGECVYRWVADRATLERRRVDAATGAVTWQECGTSAPLSPLEEEYLQKDRREFARRAETDIQTRADIAASMGVPEEAISLRGEEKGFRLVDPGHGLRAEYAASVLASAIGYEDTAIVTICGDADKGLTTVASRLAGEHATLDDFAHAVVKPDGNGRKTMIRMAMFSNLVKETDEHAGNCYFDATTDIFGRIDLGCSLGYSLYGPNGAVSVDKPRSLSGELMELNTDWTLDDEMRRNLREIADEYRAYQRSGSIQNFDGDNGRFRRSCLIKDAFRLAYERVDKDGHLVAGSDRVAEIEANDFIKRLEHWATVGRPAFLGEYSKCKCDGKGSAAQIIVDMSKKISINDDRADLGHR